MNTVQRIAKNFLSLLLSRVIGYIFGFLFVVYVARYLGAQRFGILSFAIAFTSLFGILNDFGLQQYMTRQIARNKLLIHKFLGNIAIVKLVLVVVNSLIMLLIVASFGYSCYAIQVIYIMVVTIALKAFIIMAYAIFQAYEKMHYIAVGQFLESTLKFFGALFVVSKRLDLVFLALILFASIFVVFCVSFSLIFIKFSNAEIQLDIDFIKKTLRQALPFGLSGLFITVYYYIDTLMLSYMIPHSEKIIGWYNAAYRLILILIAFPSLYVTAIFPVMARMFKESASSLQFILERSMKYILFLSLPISFGVAVCADVIIKIVFGGDYLPSAVVLRILSWSFLFASVGAIFGYLLNAIDRQSTLTRIVGIGMVLNLLLNLLLIPYYSYLGASIATNVTRLCVILIEGYILVRIGFTLPRSLLFTVLKIFGASLAMSSFLWFFKSLHPIILAVLASLVYLFFVLLLRIVDEDDLLIVKRIIALRPEGVPRA
ncbi:hypothetical protein DRN97_09420 [Methanosarcinales archaeon]|nr:MAG: hypothetical protein DRN97_09420 [Methanosarcinales archaeon]